MSSVVTTENAPPLTSSSSGSSTEPQSLSPQGKIIKGAYRFHAVITTFEMILTDCPELRSVPWRCVVIDEAHRLKNRNCKLLEGLKMMDMVSGRQGSDSLGLSQ